MPIFNPKNLYQGVNPHLNSYLQNTTGEWESFHGLLISAITQSLDAHLPPQYMARAEKSLQIRQVADFGLDDKPEKQIPDVAIYGNPNPIPVAATRTASPTLLAPILDTFDLTREDYLNAVVIYQVQPLGERFGKPVTRLELLSPTNKLPNKGYALYRDKRLTTLESGVPLVELDFLHQTSPVAANLPSYKHRLPNSTPYTITVSDPRPTLAEGITKFYGFRVDDPVPWVEIPLAGEDRLVFDFGESYNEVYERNRFCHQTVDYEILPLRFETYDEIDQGRIRQRMASIQSNQIEG